MVVDTRVAACVLRIDSINIASTTGNNVSKRFKHQDNPGLPSSLVWIAVETSFLKASTAGYASST